MSKVIPIMMYGRVGPTLSKEEHVARQEAAEAAFKSDVDLITSLAGKTIELAAVQTNAEYLSMDRLIIHFTDKTKISLTGSDDGLIINEQS